MGDAVPIVAAELDTAPPPPSCLWRGPVVGGDRADRAELHLARDGWRQHCSLPRF
jgi:hypothetical protein